ncbi:hypothetical protein [Rufibacter aurantiacus]|uniref:hypothetical protein n=1 Tax=Rufibacter aurantiacus TaxID=2817374 RepID=UPI001B30A08C|nr:hypothetical protein [Rufibacter aurantiacus]
MKQFLRLLLWLPILLTACGEDLELQPNETICQELRQSTGTGSSVEQVFESDRISEVRYLQDGNTLGYYHFTYGSSGRIEESQYMDAKTGIAQVSDMITYNDKGKWTELRSTNTTGIIYFNEAEYNGQNQLIKYTAKMERSGTVSVRYTIDFEWVGGKTPSEPTSHPPNVPLPAICLT